jgi:glucose/arabinose dehydrogenase
MPSAMTFYGGSAFPEQYRGGAFVAFHGSWDSDPVQPGFFLGFVPFKEKAVAGRYEVFATGFAGPRQHRVSHRPSGLAVSPDGALYVSDDVSGRIWRITYEGTGK